MPEHTKLERIEKGRAPEVSGQAASGCAGLSALTAGIGNQAMLAMLGLNGAPSGRAQAAPRPSGGEPLNDVMRQKFEQQFGLPMDDVRIHRDSQEPAKFDAGAYTYGSDIFMGPGQENLLDHEMTHVAQQKMGQAQPTGMEHGMAVNRSPALEHSADTGRVSQAMGTAVEPVVQCGYEDSLLHIDDDGIIRKFLIPRQYISLPYQEETFSHNHSTACDVFIKTISYRMVGKSVIECLNEFAKLAEDVGNLPGAENQPDVCSLYQRDTKELLNAAGVGLREEDELEVAFNLETLARQFLHARNMLDYTYLPEIPGEHIEAFGNDEQGAMEGIKAELGKERPDEREICRRIVDLFDVLASPRRNTQIDMTPYLNQHIQSIQMAFASLAGEGKKDALDRACEGAYRELCQRINKPRTPQEEKTIKDRNLSRGLSGLSKEQKGFVISQMEEFGYTNIGKFLDDCYSRCRHKWG